MELYVVIAIAVVIFLVVKIVYDNKNAYEMAKRKIRNSYGKIIEREYTYEEYANIAKYFLTHKTDNNYIDDITWNDLDMDSVFIMINNTFSSPGQEYLYHILRTPVYDKAKLEERNKVIKFFADNQKYREQFQIAFAKLGRTNKYSLMDYIYTLTDLKAQSSMPDILTTLFVFASIGVIFFDPQLGVLMLIASIAAAIITYFNKKKTIEPYIFTMEYIIKLLICVDDIEKIKCDEFKERVDRLSQSKKNLNKIRRNSYVLTSGSNNVGGGLEVILLDYLRMLFHIDIIKFNSMLKHIKNSSKDIEMLISEIGFIESMISIASFREWLLYYSIPELNNDGKVYMEAEKIYHPLIDDPVTNSFSLKRGALITGSNASGKSTFLKTVAINAILSQTIYTSLSKKYRSVYFKIFSSMALQDNLESKESYYIVEIKSLKRIIDCNKDIPVLCFIDEVLRGTNTVERIAASAQILKSLASDKVMAFAATHDIELTYMLETYYTNYHFQEEVLDDDIKFNYKLNDGRAYSRNAIKLLSIIGYDNSIIDAADLCAANFLEKGEWKL